MAKIDRATRELDITEVATIKDNARKVEVQALPRHRGAIF